MGKSALGLCIAANLGVRSQIPVALFTLEMSKAEVTQRLMCSEAKVESERFGSGKLTQELAASHRRVRQADEGADLRRRHGLDHDDGAPFEGAAAEGARAGSGLIIVDYLQLMTSGGTAENRVQEVSQISRT